MSYAFTRELRLSDFVFWFVAWYNEVCASYVAHVTHARPQRHQPRHNVTQNFIFCKNSGTERKYCPNSPIVNRLHVPAVRGTSPGQSGTNLGQRLLRNVVFRLRHADQPVVKPSDDVLQTLDTVPRLARTRQFVRLVWKADHHGRYLTIL